MEGQTIGQLKIDMSGIVLILRLAMVLTHLLIAININTTRITCLNFGSLSYQESQIPTMYPLDLRTT